MNATCEWFYDKANELMEEVNTAEDEELERLADTLELTQENRCILIDSMTELRVRWGAEVFALGLQLGLRLTIPH